MVATPPDPGSCLVTGPSGIADPGVQPSLSEATILGQPRAGHRASHGVVAGVQPALRSPVRVDLEQPEDAEMIRRASTLNSLHDFRPGPLAVFAVGQVALFTGHGSPPAPSRQRIDEGLPGWEMAVITPSKHAGRLIACVRVAQSSTTSKSVIKPEGVRWTRIPFSASSAKSR
jgi:hypothetical protein